MKVFDHLWNSCFSWISFVNLFWKPWTNLDFITFIVRNLTANGKNGTKSRNIFIRFESYKMYPLGKRDFIRVSKISFTSHLCFLVCEWIWSSLICDLIVLFSHKFLYLMEMKRCCYVSSRNDAIWHWFSSCLTYKLHALTFPPVFSLFIYDSLSSNE